MECGALWLMGRILINLTKKPFLQPDVVHDKGGVVIHKMVVVGRMDDAHFCGPRTTTRRTLATLGKVLGNPVLAELDFGRFSAFGERELRR